MVYSHLVVLFFCLSALAFGQNISSTYVATTYNYLNPDVLRVIYADPEYGQRFDIYEDSMDTYPSSSTVLFTLPNGTVNRVVWIFNEYDDVQLHYPICFETNKDFSSQLVSFNLGTKIGYGKVFNETTLMYFNSLSFNWYYVANSTKGKYYPRVFGDVFFLNIVDDFELAVPYDEAWEMPTCFPDYPMKRSIAPPVAAIPSTCSLSIVFNTIQDDYYLDYVNGYVRSDVVIPASMHYPSGTTSILIRDQTEYFYVTWLNIQPSPCTFNSNGAPFFDILSAVYTGSAEVGNQTNPKVLDLYLNENFDIFWGYNSKTGALESGYSYGNSFEVDSFQTPVAPSVFNVPAKCFPVPPFSGPPNPQAPPFPPKGMTMYTLNAVTEYVYYYDAANQFWRIDMNDQSLLQRGNTQYYFLKPSQSPIITPLPCYMTQSTYGFIPDLAPYFFSKLGNATLDGKILNVWSAPSSIWYFDNINVPVFIFSGKNQPIIVTYYEPTVPPSGVFDIPTNCVDRPFSKDDVLNPKKRFSLF